MGEDSIQIVAVGQAVFLACTTVHLAQELMDLEISEISIDYIEYPSLGRFDAIFFTLGKTHVIDFETKMKEIDEQIVLMPGERGQVITVAKDTQPAKLALLALFKLKNAERIKLVGAGAAINQTVSIALMLTKGKLARTPLGIEFMGLSNVLAKDAQSRATTGINIYLRKNQATSYSAEHAKLVEQLQSGKVA